MLLRSPNNFHRHSDAWLDHQTTAINGTVFVCVIWQEIDIHPSLVISQLSVECQEIDWKNQGKVGKNLSWKLSIADFALELCMSILLLNMTWVTTAWVGVLQIIGKMLVISQCPESDQSPW